MLGAPATPLAARLGTLPFMGVGVGRTKSPCVYRSRLPYGGRDHVAQFGGVVEWGIVKTTHFKPRKGAQDCLVRAVQGISFVVSTNT